MDGPLARGAVAVDAFAQDWTVGLPYLFPPVQRLLRVLAKVRNDGARAVIAVATVVDTIPDDADKHGRPGRRRKCVVAGPRDDRLERDIAASARRHADGHREPQPADYGQWIRDAVRGDDYRQAIEWVIAALYVATYSERAMHVWWNNMTPSTIRSRLHDWRVWANYCQEEGVRPETVKQYKDPPSIVTEFVAYMADVDTPMSYRTEAIPAVKDLFRILGVGQSLDEHELLKGMIKGTTKRIHQQSRYRQILDIGIMFDYVRDARL
jgi:hypothetical protein